MRKYEITDVRHPYLPHLRRIKALRRFITVVAPQSLLGGWVESEYNLSHEGDCWIDIDAMAYGDSMVMDNALLLDNSRVYGRAIICGSAWIGNQAQVYGEAEVWGGYIGGTSQICGTAVIGLDTEVWGDAVVEGGIYTRTQLHDGWHLG